jgi:signal transduction histidine kinase
MPMTPAKPKILVVEDERIVAEDIRRSLESLGYQVVAAVSSGGAALQEAGRLSPDLILMDIVLEGEMSGIQAAEEIRRCYSIPVIYLTAYADQAILDQAKITEPFGYVVKPFEERELRSAIEMALYKHRSDVELKRSREQLRNLAAHLESVREDERTLVAREIHDELGQALTALKMDLSWLAKKLASNRRSLADKVSSMIQLVNATIQTVKRLTARLRPGLLDDLGLAAAIEWQAEEFQTHTGIRCRMNISPSEEEFILDRERSTALFRIFQEALTNVARHSGATEVSGRLMMNENGIELSLQDNGRGITGKQISSSRSYGIMGMRERAQFLGGRLEIDGADASGTAIRVTIPLENRRQE